VFGNNFAYIGQKRNPLHFVLTLVLKRCILKVDNNKIVW